MNYWSAKEKLSKIANKKVKDNEVKYAELIEVCARESNIYSPDSVFNNVNVQKFEQTYVNIYNLNTVDAIMVLLHDEERIAVLNFASYKEPGGRFLDGSSAQEESLCHSSFLYNVLSRHQDYYDWNNKNKNKALYLNRAIYSHDIKFIQTKDKFEFDINCDVITCAAPNWSTANKYNLATAQENLFALRDRIKFILNIAAAEQVDILVLGAFGCGVFGQDPKIVASIFKDELSNNFRNTFKYVVFAIPIGKNNNAFRDVFGI